MKVHYKSLASALVVLAGTFSACQQQDSEEPQPQTAQKRQLSAAEQVKADRYKQTALVLLQVLHDDKPLLETLSLEVKIDKYQHEQISFEKLFMTSKWAQNTGKKSLQGFKASFEKALETNKYPHAEQFAREPNLAARGTAATVELETALMAEGTDVYFPYSELFVDVSNPTITYAPLNSTEESTGFYYADTDGDGVEEVVEVTVDENYVQAHPTFIVQPLDESETTTSTESIVAAPQGTLGTKDTLNQIFIGYVRLDKQLDGLFGDGAGNSGGSELRFIRPKGFLSVDASGQVDLNKEAPAIVSVDMSRLSIRRGYHTHQYITFDSDWNRTEKTQYFVVYEHDNATERTKTAKSTFKVDAGATLPTTGSTPGGPTRTVSVGTTRELTEELKYKTKEEILWQQDFGRSIFFTLNTLDQFNGRDRDNFPYWKAASDLKFSTPRREVIYER